MSKQWADVQASNGVLSINIYDEVGGFGVNASHVLNEVAAFKGDEIKVDLNSPGGNAFDGLAIYNKLSNSPANVHTNITGMAASSASLIYMAGDHRSMPENGYVMIHNPWMIAMGDSSELEKYASDLQKFQDTYADIYSARTGVEKDEILDMMGKESWLDGSDASELGFTHEVTKEQRVSAMTQSFASMFNSVPDELSGNGFDLSAVTDIKSYEKALRDVGISRSKAKQLAGCAKSLFQREAEAADEAVMNAQYEQLVKSLQSFKVN